MKLKLLLSTFLMRDVKFRMPSANPYAKLEAEWDNIK